MSDSPSPASSSTPTADSIQPTTFDDGRRRWQVELPDPLVAHWFATDGETVFLVARSAKRDSQLTPENATRTEASPSPSPTLAPDATPTPTGTIFALRASDGAERWRLRPGASVLHPPVVTDGRVHTVLGQRGMFGGIDTRVVAYDRRGEKLWTASRGNGSLNIVATDDDHLYVGTSDDALGSSGEVLFAVDDGTVVWEREAGDASRALRVDDRLLYASGGRAIASYDPADGTRHWKVEEGLVNAYSRQEMTTPGGVVFTEDSPDDSVVARSIDDGSELWRYAGPANSGQRFVPTGITDVPEDRIDAVDGPLYAGTDYGGAVFALGADGTERWTFDAEADTPYGLTAGDAIYVSTRDGTLYALDPVDGEERWQHSFQAFPTVYPGSNGVLVTLLGSENGPDEMIQFAADGSQRWRYTPEKNVITAQKFGDRIYAATGDGSVLALGV